MNLNSYICYHCSPSDCPEEDCCDCHLSIEYMGEEIERLQALLKWYKYPENIPKEEKVYIGIVQIGICCPWIDEVSWEDGRWLHHDFPDDKIVLYYKDTGELPVEIIGQ